MSGSYRSRGGPPPPAYPDAPSGRPYPKREREAGDDAGAPRSFRHPPPPTADSNSRRQDRSDPYPAPRRPPPPSAPRAHHHGGPSPPPQQHQYQQRYDSAPYSYEAQPPPPPLSPSMAMFYPAPSHPHQSYPYYMSHAMPPPLPPPAAFPPSAPRLVIPGDLPIDEISLMDLLAFHVAQSGPTVEEEITFREEANAHFDFITAKASESPQNAYYRWRLYSLLQGDTMARWRTQPFQMERHPDAYVYVPPPALVAGPECLRGAYDRALSHSSAPPGDCSRQPRERYPAPSSYWLSRSLTGEGKAFGTLSPSDAATWRAMLDASAQVESALRDADGADASRGLEEVVREASERWLAADAIAQKMAFAIEHAQLSVRGIGGAAPHVMSLLLDAMVKVAYDAADALTDSTPSPPAAAAAPLPPVHQHHQESTSGSGMRRCARLALLCVAQLSLLFLVHDISQNAKAVPLLSEEDLQAAEAQAAKEEEQKKAARALLALAGGGGGGGNSSSNSSGSTAALNVPIALTGKAFDKRSLTASAAASSNASSPLAITAVASTSTRSLKTILSAVEAILPTALEAVTLTALAAMSLSGDGDRTGTGHPTSTSALGASVEDAGPSLTAAPFDMSADMNGAPPYPPRRNLTVTLTRAGKGFPANDSDPQRQPLHAQSAGGSARPAEGGSGEAEVEKVRQIGEMLLSWSTQLLCAWSNRDVKGATSSSPACAHVGARAAKDAGAAEEEERPEPISFRGRAMVLLLEKYDWLLSRPTS